MSETHEDIPAEVIQIRWETIQNVLRMRDEFDGIEFGHDEDSATIVYTDDLWALNLFMLQLADVMGGILTDDDRGFERTYDTLAKLTMEMSLPVMAPEQGDGVFGVKLPCIRVTGQPKDN